ncbi:MAG: GTPase HflX [bacterium]
MRQEDGYYVTDSTGLHERVVLVGVNLPTAAGYELGGDADTEELARLVKTAGGQVVGVVEQNRRRPDARTFVGKGKLAEVKQKLTHLEANLVVFDNELAPAQGRNLEEELKVNVLDRTELILDIFARHARTHQARLQVELAQLQYMMPRLARLWKHLERQAGGIGTRGPGETQIETDRQLIRHRISLLRKSLREIVAGRKIQRHRRRELYRAVLVGYTNAGKSTLLNSITDADVYVQDKLFATLDATTRRVEIDERRQFLLTDTVGFIRRLPHNLVESFKATLQEVVDADLLVHVVDASSTDPEEQIAAVNTVLADIVPTEKPTLYVFNKMDLVADRHVSNRFSRRYPGALFVSATAESGAASVTDTIANLLLGKEQIYQLEIPLTDLGCLGIYHRTGSVLEQEYGDGFCRAAVRLNKEELQRLLASRPAVRLTEES